MIALPATGRYAHRMRDVRRAQARRETLDAVGRDAPGHDAWWPGAETGPARPGPRSEASVARASPPGLILPAPVDDAFEDGAPWDLLDELEVSVDWRALENLHEHAPVAAEPESPRSPTLADVIRAFAPEYRRRFAHAMTEQQDRVLRELMACYTPLMGTHKWTCQDCGTVVELPNACQNRHCPCCGDAKRRQWAANTASQLLPVQYYHVMLTVPREITQLALAYPSVLYGMMLRIGADTILRCGRLLFDVELALLSLLHSWGSLLNAHLHTHSMLPAGGLRRRALEWIALSRKQIKEVLVLATTEFPERFITALRKAYDEGRLPYDGDPGRQYLESRAAFDRWLASFNTTQWVIRCPQVWDRREALDDPENTGKTLKYLANYANRVALSNDRILGIVGSDVLLRCKDYRDGGQWKTRRIDGVEFLRRFLQHLLPQGMHHIRRYGWMARRASNEKLTWLREYFGIGDPSDAGPSNAAGAEGAQLPEEAEPWRRCRYCEGTMYLTNRTERPRVIEIMWMPWKRFDQARPGPIVTLGPRVPDVRPGSAPRGVASAQEVTKAEAGREASSRPTSAFL